MKAVLLPVCLAVVGFGLLAVASAGETVKVFGKDWTVEKSSNWAVENGVLRLLEKGEPAPGNPADPPKSPC